MDTQTYKKRDGTSGIQGQLYETKLISLIIFRMLHDDRVEQFSLATNRDDIGAFDDICFKAKIKGFDKPVTVFMQAKHRINDKHLLFTSKTDLAKYFGSYLQIRSSFEPRCEDMIFEGKFDETECFFVIYTTAQDNPNNQIYEGTFAEYLNKLIGTGDCCTQTSYKDEDLDFLCKIVMKKQITTLAEQLAKFICDESDSELSMNNDIMFCYHVILALKVLNVSEIQPEGYRFANFRDDFFTTNDEFLVLIKNILCLEILKKLKLMEDTDTQSLLLKFLSEPSDMTTLGELLIGNVLQYKNDKLEFVGKSTADDLKRQLDKANVSQLTVYETAELAAKEYLLSLKLKVPTWFGNKDLEIRGNDEKIQKRLKHLTKIFLEILKQSKSDHIITIDESLEGGFLRLNGGIASAVGNMLVIDETSKLLKFTDTCESLGKLAKTWYETLKKEIPNLNKYRLNVKVKNFPKLSFERGEYDLSLVRDFYNKLLFYTNQADQNVVEDILKGEIKDHPCDDVTNFSVRSGLIYLKYHDVIQKLWMEPKKGIYITKKSEKYENAVTYAMNESLIGVLNKMHSHKNLHYTFNESTIKRIGLHDQILGTIIASESCVLTVAKVEQYLGDKNHAVLDLEYIFKLPLESYNTLCKELKNTTKEMIFIFVYNHSRDSEDSCERLEDIAKVVDGMPIIIITSTISVDIMTQHFSQAGNVLNDDRIVFTDLSEESQKKLLAASEINFQGVYSSLDVIVDDESTKLIQEDVLNKIINNETITIGRTVIDSNYQEPYYLHIQQKDDKFDENKNKILRTFYDVEDDFVLITKMPAESTVLTHLSLKTKELDPKVWIVRINLKEHANVLSKWQIDNTVINTVNSLKFMCQVALGDELNREGEVFIELEESSNGIVSIRNCTGGKATIFQLKMFLHFYNRRKLIFLFDEFGEIYPRYRREALSLIRSVRSYPRQQKVWITSRSFFRIKSVLEGGFGRSYELKQNKSSRFEQDTSESSSSSRGQETDLVLVPSGTTCLSSVVAPVLAVKFGVRDAVAACLEAKLNLIYSLRPIN